MLGTRFNSNNNNNYNCSSVNNNDILNNNNNNNINLNMVDTPNNNNLNLTASGKNINMVLLNKPARSNPHELITISHPHGTQSSYTGGFLQNTTSGYTDPDLGPSFTIRDNNRLSKKSNPKKDATNLTNSVLRAISPSILASGASSFIVNPNYNNNNEEPIHSGHFMLSQVHEDTGYEDDIVVKEENDSQTPEGFDFLTATKETSTSYNFSNGYSPIDGSLTKLFECMTLAYSGKIISPKWKPFKGMRLRGKEIVRLNNIIWREWYMQYIQNKKPIVCQFANPLPDDIHKRTEAVVMEGKYWKRRLQSVTGEYKSWRQFSKNLIAQSRRNSTASKGSFQADLYDWSYQGNASNQDSADILFGMEDMEFSDTIFSLNQPFPFPNPRELSQTGYSELIQPVLTQLQPNLDDYMDTLEPIQMISDMLSTSVPQGFPILPSPMASSYHSIPDGLLVAMDNDSAPSLQLRMDSTSPGISLGNQQLREKDQPLGILPQSPSVAATSALPSEAPTASLVQQDDTATISTFPQLCSQALGNGGSSVNLPSETSLALPQTDSAHLLDKILMQPSGALAALPQAPSPQALNQRQQQQLTQPSTFSSRATSGGPANLGREPASSPAFKVKLYKDLMSIKPVYNTYKDPLAPSKQPGQQPPVCSAPLSAPTHSPQPQLSSAHQRDPISVGNTTRTSLSMITVAPPARVGPQTGQILSGSGSVGLGPASQGSATVTIEDSPASNESIGNRSSPTRDLFQAGAAVSGRKRHSFSKSLGSRKKEGFAIPSSTPMIRSKYRPVTVSTPSSIPRTEISSSSSTTSSPSSSNTFLAQLLTTGKYHGAGRDVKPEPRWKPCIISTVSLATTTTLTSAYPRIQPAQDTTSSTQSTSTNPISLISPSPTSIPINYTQPSVLVKATSMGNTAHPHTKSPQLSNLSSSVLPLSSSPPFSRNNKQSQESSTGFIIAKTANPTCSPPDPSSTPNSPTLSLGSPLSSGQEMDVSFPTSQQKGACPKSKQSRGHCREHRRVSHISAEQKRRCNIKSGFDVLHSLIPSLNQTPCGKVSKAAMLQKAAEFCKKMKAERLKMQNESEVLKLEIDSLNSDITYCQSQLPATGAPVTRQRVDQMNSMYEEYVRTRTNENWKFYIFSFIIHPLFKSFNNMVSTSSWEEMCRTVMTWFDQYCSLVTLRPTVSNALREVCTSTAILTEPERVPEQAASATGLRRRHSISGSTDIS